MREYDVPVWIRIKADTKNEAFESVISAMLAANDTLVEADTNIVDWVANEDSIVTHHNKEN
jgi:hypothetical protein